MRLYRGGVLAAAVLAVAACLSGTATAAADGGAEDAAYSAKGADTCLKCHDEDKKVPVLSIFKTRHARPADARTPFAGHQCEACHGPGDTHARGADDDPVPPIRNFGVGTATPVGEQNEVCLSCHQGGHRTLWPGSAHEQSDVPCAACHRVHAARDPMLDATTQVETCVGCHREQRTQMLKPFAHPLRQGMLACADCHAAHGAVGEALTTSPTVNETCYRCHAEKRGPFLWEHAPAAEDCGLCHTPHGSSQPSLLVQRAPWLCQSCHASQGHPSVAFTGSGLSDSGLAGGTPSAFLLGQGCVNCHSQVHGSNHPSGATLTR